MSEKSKQRLIEAVRSVHSRGEYPSRRKVLAQLGRAPSGTLSPAWNVERLAEIRRLGLEVIVAKAGWKDA